MAKRKQRTETAARHDFVRVCAFIGILVSALIFTVGAILNWCGFGRVTSILHLVAQLTLLVAVAIPAWEFVRGKRKDWKIIFWIALAIYVLGCVFGVIGIYVIK